MAVSVGIDLGGHNIKAGLVEDGGNIIRKIEEKTVSREPYPVIEQIGRIARELGACESIPLGVGIPGGLDASREIALMISNFVGWNGLHLRNLIEESAKAPTRIENDANVYALGESWGGAAEGLKNYVVLTLGTGIGGGIVINGKIFAGSHGLAGEPGHIVIGKDEKCGSGCGGIGHLEAICAADALERKAAQMNLSSDMKELWLRREEKNVAPLFDFMLDNLSRGIASIAHILDPEAIILGGGLSKGEGFLDAIRSKISTYLGIPYREILDLRLSIHGNDAPIIGAAALAKSY